MLIEKCVEFQLPALAIFGFKAAFDSPSMWHFRSDYGIPDKYIRLIRCVYDNCEAAILVEGEITDWCSKGMFLVPTAFCHNGRFCSSQEL